MPQAPMGYAPGLPVTAGDSPDELLRHLKTALKNDFGHHTVHGIN